MYSGDRKLLLATGLSSVLAHEQTGEHEIFTLLLCFRGVLQSLSRKQL